ncbi:MAG TPA: hypothetical protein VFA33_05060 [Bryobacteraceae bacterium]|nr:hypothetical protein [Bryobacteraceae bacterium]
MFRLKTCIFALLVLLVATGAFGQTAIYVGAGPSLYTTSPFGAANLAIGICNASANTCSLTGFEARGSVKDPKNLVYSTSTGVRQVVATASSPAIKVDLFVLGQGGAAVTGSAVGLAATLGGGLTFHPARAPNWGFTLAAREIYSPVNPGWQPWFHAQIGYTFQGTK